MEGRGGLEERGRGNWVMEVRDVGRGSASGGDGCNGCRQGCSRCRREEAAGLCASSSPSTCSCGCSRCMSDGPRTYIVASPLTSSAMLSGSCAIPPFTPPGPASPLSFKKRGSGTFMGDGELVKAGAAQRAEEGSGGDRRSGEWGRGWERGAGELGKGAEEGGGGCGSVVRGWQGMGWWRGGGGFGGSGEGAGLLPFFLRRASPAEAKTATALLRGVEFERGRVGSERGGEDARRGLSWQVRPV